MTWWFPEMGVLPNQPFLDWFFYKPSIVRYPHDYGNLHSTTNIPLECHQYIPVDRWFIPLFLGFQPSCREMMIYRRISRNFSGLSRPGLFRPGEMEDEVGRVWEQKEVFNAMKGEYDPRIPNICMELYG